MTSYVLTLLCDPSFPALTDRHLARASEALPSPQPPVWLDKGIAADIVFEAEEPIDARAFTEMLREKIADPQIDLAVQPVDGRRKKLLIIDMDKGLLRQNTCDEIAAVIKAEPQLTEIRAKVADGALSHADGARAFAVLLHGRTPDCLQQVLGKRMQMRPGSKELVETMRANGGQVLVATYGFSCFAGPVGQKIGIPEIAANRVMIENHRIGSLAEPILDPTGKAAVLDQHMTAAGLTPKDVIVVAAETADLPLFAGAGQRIAFHAEAAVAAAADVTINQGDLSALLYLQGYAKEAFISEARRELDASDWKRKYGGYEKAHERTRL